MSFKYFKPQVYWFKDGKQISKRSEHYRISRDPDGTCSLHTAAASLDDDGNYTVLAGNPEVKSKRKKRKTSSIYIWEAAGDGCAHYQEKNVY